MKLGTTWLETVWQDIRHAARSLVHSPAFTLTAVLSLALGIGATTTIFSVVHAVVIDPFPYRSPDTLVSLALVGPDGRGNWSTYTIDEYVELTERASAFEGLIASTISDISMTRYRDARAPARQLRLDEHVRRDGRADPARAHPDGGRRPGRRAAGRDPGLSLLAATVRRRCRRRRPNAPPRRRDARGHRRDAAAVHVARRRRLPADPLPPRPRAAGRAHGPRHGAPRPRHLAGRRRSRRCVPSPPTSRPAPPIGSRRRSAWSSTSFSETFSSSLGPTLGVLLGAVGLLLLIACGNVSNLQLARATARAREMALRASLGASRWRLVRQLLTESALLAACGGVLGVLLAQASLWAVTTVIPPGTIPDESHVRLNGPVLVFSIVLATVSTLVAGLVPAWQVVAHRCRAGAARRRPFGHRRCRSGPAARRAGGGGDRPLDRAAGRGRPDDADARRHAAGPAHLRSGADPDDARAVRRSALPGAAKTAPGSCARCSARVAAVPGVQSATVDSGLPFVGARRHRRHDPRAAEDRSRRRSCTRRRPTTCGSSGPGSSAGRTLERGRRRRRASRRRRSTATSRAGSSGGVADRPDRQPRLPGPSAAEADGHRLRGRRRHRRPAQSGPQRDPAPEIYVPFAVNGGLRLPDRRGAGAAAAARAHHPGRGLRARFRSSR